MSFLCMHVLYVPIAKCNNSTSIPKNWCLPMYRGIIFYAYLVTFNASTLTVTNVPQYRLYWSTSWHVFMQNVWYFKGPSMHQSIISYCASLICIYQECNESLSILPIHQSIIFTSARFMCICQECNESCSILLEMCPKIFHWYKF